MWKIDTTMDVMDTLFNIFNSTQIILDDKINLAWIKIGTLIHVGLSLLRPPQQSENFYLS